ncbi:Rne/Rng family ribonuclease [Sphingorhabdus sp.]|uniref:Rne/Rng family ribonuclease n=1 Tax=Sphingorhabdus sp. TaxID=1902408 RepID=UPI003593E554
MTTRMLIDARHREETRVAVVTGNRIEEFDFESAEHKQLKGNIYLAKVTRVEPSLQAAFVDYGGNRHGFLAFAEIHPDYYQIPREDRERLLAEEAEAAAEEAALREQEEEESEEPSDIMQGSEEREDEVSDFIEIDSDDSVDTIDMSEGEEPDLSANGDEANDETGRDETNARNNRRRRGRGGRNGGEGRAPKASDEVRAKRMNLRRRYKIQDVIHRRQVLLVQVVKEERGNKGAALTTYLSLAGRYCVLMPNTSHGGGISRKIHSAADRKRLKSIISDLTLPSTMGCIIRTAGLARTKPEIKRDFDYLARLWDEIRERTLRGAAPMLIHTDSDLIKRAIRDIYNKDIEEVFVEGPEGYKAAKDFMKLLMPSHAKRVQHYADPVPLFQRYHVEDQLNAMYQPIVQLKSGGYIVINPTEALVSIDINSGRSTKEHGIEATALSTNLEAAREIARQLRLRDMAGLVVIDFIDMEHHGNARKVERAMKEALKHDRARIQVGRISGFGLMEMSRQRLRTGVLEASTRQCPHCEGTGLVRTASSAALSALRLIEEEAAKGNGSQIVLQASQEATIYCLNNKRGELADIEERYHVRVLIVPNGETEGAKLAVSSSGPRPEAPLALPPIIDVEEDDFEEEIDDFEAEEEEEANEPRRAREDRPRDDSEGGEGRRRKRRRGRRGGKSRERDDRPENADGQIEPDAENGDNIVETEAETETAPTDDTQPKARRGRRGGRGRGRVDTDSNGTDVDAESGIETTSEESAILAPVADESAPEKPKRRSRAKPKAEVVAVVESIEAPTVVADEKPAPKRRSKAKAVSEEPETVPAAPVAEEAPIAKPKATRKKAPAKAAETTDEQPAENDGPPRTGWWQRTFG